MAKADGLYLAGSRRQALGQDASGGSGDRKNDAEDQMRVVGAEKCRNFCARLEPELSRTAPPLSFCQDPARLRSASHSIPNNNVLAATSGLFCLKRSIASEWLSLGQK